VTRIDRAFRLLPDFAASPEPRLLPGTLARFARGLGWPEILAITDGRGASWWRDAVGDAEDRGLLRWDRKARAWRLTDDGRELVRAVT
jgi:hypothetical protein